MDPQVVTAAALTPFIVVLVGLLKPFIPASVVGDQRESATRLLAVACGVSLEVAAYLFAVAQVSRPALGAAVAAGAGAGLAAVAGYHGATAALGAVRPPAQAAQAAPPAPAGNPALGQPLFPPVP